MEKLSCIEYIFI